MAQRILETVLSDGADGLPASALTPHVGVPASWLGLGRYRSICPTLAVLPPVTLEDNLVGNTVWRSNSMFAAADNVRHGWMGRLAARAADRAGVEAGRDGSMRLLGELLELARWSLHIPDREPDERFPAPPEAAATSPSQVQRMARRDRFLAGIEATP